MTVDVYSKGMSFIAASPARSLSVHERIGPPIFASYGIRRDVVDSYG
jgi:hypothetical protein